MLSDVLLWARLASDELGPAWLTPALFRFGCVSEAAAILAAPATASASESTPLPTLPRAWPKPDATPPPAAAAGVAMVYGVDYRAAADVPE